MAGVHNLALNVLYLPFSLDSSAHHHLQYAPCATRRPRLTCLDMLAGGGPRILISERARPRRPLHPYTWMRYPNTWLHRIQILSRRCRDTSRSRLTWLGRMAGASIAIGPSDARMHPRTPALPRASPPPYTCSPAGVGMCLHLHSCRCSEVPAPESRSHLTGFVDLMAGGGITLGSHDTRMHPRTQALPREPRAPPRPARRPNTLPRRPSPAPRCGA